MATLRYVVADVFTETPLTGNQLAVFTDARELDDATMQALALEVGFDETVFVFPPESGGTVRIRIFTPYFELPFAGHPTLGTAFVLGAPLQLEVIVLETGRGHVPVRLERDESGRIVFGRMEQPVPSVSRSRRRTSCSRRSASRARSFPSSCTTTARRISSSALGSEERAGRAAARRTPAVVGARGDRRELLRRARDERWTLRMFWAGGEDAATGSAAGPARLPPRPPRPHRLGRRDHDLAGRPRSAGRRRSTRAPTAAKG